MKYKGTKKLDAFYKVFNEGDNVLIMINADPDSMASSLAVKRLLWRKVSSITISNINIVARPDNLEMINLLHIKMTHINDIRMDDYNRFVILDSQPNHNESFSRIQHYDIVIDHHPDTDYEASFADIRPEYGATATILTEYLRSARIKPSVRVATGLFHAIKIDTRNFERKAIAEDMRAFQFLFKHMNLMLARKIEQSEVKFTHLRYYKKALVGKTMRRGKLFVHLGSVENPDICVHIADFFLRVESVKWSVVSGIYNETLVIIFRNDGIRKNAGKLSADRFGEFGNAGGHKVAARAEIPVKILKKSVNPYNNGTLFKWIMKKVN